MKKMIIAFALIATTIGNTAMAGEEEIDKRIMQSFKREFSGAMDVKWYPSDNYVKVDFTFRDMRLMVYYSTDGETLALVQNIRFSSLPLMLQLDLRKNYKEYWITQICEVANKEGTQYYLTLENADKIVRLRSNGSFDWYLNDRKVK